MADEQTNTPVENTENTPVTPPVTPPEVMPADSALKDENPPAKPPKPSVDAEMRMEERLERLGGEPAPAITPEEFARLQKAGQVHIDAQGRVRSTRRNDAEAGVSLRKRRAWYGG
jgi:hypothetical protein